MRYRMRIGGAALGLAVVAMLAAGCGGSKSSTTSTSPGQQPGGSDSVQAYLSCLSKNGVTMQMPSGRPSFPGDTRPSGVRPSGAFPSGAFPSGVRPSGGFPGGGGGFPGGGGGGLFQKPSNVDDATWQKAQAACASVRPSFGSGGGNGDNGATAAYRNCLSQHGVTVGNGPLNTADPKYAAAAKACAPLRPSVAPSATG